MCICDRSKTQFDRAKIKLTGHSDRRHFGRYFEPCASSNSARGNELFVILCSTCQININLVEQTALAKSTVIF